MYADNRKSILIQGVNRYIRKTFENFLCFKLHRFLNFLENQFTHICREQTRPRTLLGANKTISKAYNGQDNYILCCV